MAIKKLLQMLRINVTNKQSKKRENQILLFYQIF